MVASHSGQGSGHYRHLEAGPRKLLHRELAFVLHLLGYRAVSETCPFCRLASE